MSPARRSEDDLASLLRRAAELADRLPKDPGELAQMEARGQMADTIADASLGERVAKLEERVAGRATREQTATLEERIDARASVGQVWKITFTVAGAMAGLLLLATRLLPAAIQLPVNPAG